MLKNKIAIVTGAANGIGKSICESFARNGCTVIGIDLAENTVLDIAYYQLDVTNYVQVEETINKVIEKFNHIDILVNCAGITRDAITKKMTEQQFDDVINVNLKGVWNMTKFVGMHMMEQRIGSIVNISSVVGLYGNIGQANYAASKAGVVGMSKSFAKEFTLKGENIRVNVVAPGYTLTDMVKTVPQDLLDKFASQTMLNRLAEPEEISNVVLFLSSDLSSYVTGEVINVNGGMRL